jgi:hypothetical protein
VRECEEIKLANVERQRAGELLDTITGSAEPPDPYE